MSVATPELTRGLLERVLLRLGLDHPPHPTLDGLTTLYTAWCRHVPFDNVRKLIHVQSNAPGPLPGDEAGDFFEAWLQYGTGGTCWAGNGALYTLLASLGFAAERGVATMLSAPNVPPSHGTVSVRCDGGLYLVDASILYSTPLPLDEQAVTGIDHPSWGVQCAKNDGHWVVRWRPLHKVDGMDCRVEYLGASRQEFRDRHERTRAWSPFNYAVYARRILGETMVGVAFGKRVEFDRTGHVHQEPLQADAQQRLLVEELGIKEEIVARLPPDQPTPPRPQSHRGGATYGDLPCVHH